MGAGYSGALERSRCSSTTESSPGARARGRPGSSPVIDSSRQLPRQLSRVLDVAPVLELRQLVPGSSRSPGALRQLAPGDSSPAERPGARARGRPGVLESPRRAPGAAPVLELEVARGDSSSSPGALRERARCRALREMSVHSPANVRTKNAAVFRARHATPERTGSSCRSAPTRGAPRPFAHSPGVPRPIRNRAKLPARRQLEPGVCRGRPPLIHL
jgi:hypothetical protein